MSIDVTTPPSNHSPSRVLVIIELLTTLLCKNKSKILNYKDKKQIIKNSVLEFIEEKIPVKYEAYNVPDRIEKIKRKLRMK